MFGRKRCSLFVLLLMLVWVLAGCSSDKDEVSDGGQIIDNNDVGGGDGQNSNNAADEPEVIMDFQYAYSAKGVCYTENCIAHFFDAETGNDVVLCSKPNCPHKRTGSDGLSDCDAYLGSKTDHPFLTDKNLFFFASPENNSDNSDWFFDCIMYKADLDGRNRREITKLVDVEGIEDAAYYNGYVAVCYISTLDRNQKDYEYEDEEAFSYGQREKQKSGIYLINIENGETKLIDEYEEYAATCYNCMFSNGKLYYCAYRCTEKYDFSDYTDVSDFYEKTADARSDDIIEYDLKTGEKKKICDAKISFIGIIGNGYYAISDRMAREYTSIYKDGKEIAYFTSEEMSPADYKPVFYGKYVYDEKLYLMDGIRFWYKDLKTGEIKYAADGKLNDKGIYGIDAIIGDWVYYTTDSQVGEDVTQSRCLIDKTSFFEGKLEGAKILSTSNFQRPVKNDASYSDAENNGKNENNNEDANPDDDITNKDGESTDQSNVGEDSGIDNSIEYNNTENNPDLVQNIPSNAEIEAMKKEFVYYGPDDENTITWAIMMNTFDDGESACERVNKKLKEDGYDFSFGYCELAPPSLSGDAIRYYRYLMMECDADIVYTGMHNQNDTTIWSPCYEAIKKGKLLKLDDYLKGSSLYDYFPEKLWDAVRVDGGIYCIPNPTANASCFSVVFKKSVYTEDEVSRFDDTIEGLRPFLSEKNKLYCLNTSFLSMYGLNQTDTFGIYYEDAEIKNQMECDIYVAGIKTLHDYYMEGLAMDIKAGPKECEDEWSVALISDIVMVRDLDPDKYYVKTYKGFVGSFCGQGIAIKADTDNPENAFRMVELIMTDPDYANALLYGENIIEKDGYAYDPENDEYKNPYWMKVFFGISEIAYECKNDPERFKTPEERKEYYDNNLGPVITSCMDYPVEVNKLWNLAEEHEKIVYNMKNFDEELNQWIADSREIFQTIR